MLTVVGGNDQPGMTQEQMHANIVSGLRRVTDIIEASKVMLILEPMNIRVDHKGHCLYSSDDAIRICRSVGSPWVKINWDVYHLQIMEGDLTRRIRDGFEEIGYIQIADNPGRNESGTGEIDYSRVFVSLPISDTTSRLTRVLAARGRKARARRSMKMTLGDE